VPINLAARVYYFGALSVESRGSRDEVSSSELFLSPPPPSRGSSNAGSNKALLGSP
jgi:hypothetical protein